MIPQLTPYNIAQPLPDLTGAIAPAPIPCSWWADLNGTINDHPGVALLALGTVALLLWRRK